MAKKMTINDHKTEWHGLWYIPELHYYRSSAFNVNSLRDYKGNVRIIAKKNRFFKEGTNRPNMQFMIAGCACEEARDLVFEKEEQAEEERLYTEDEVYTIIHGMESEYNLGYGNNLIEDYL